MARFAEVWAFDEAVRNESGKRIGGVDEAGRGPLAGPVVAAAVVLPTDLRMATIYDSKQLNKVERENAYTYIVDHALSYGIGIVDPAYIDQYNILQATYQAMRIALQQLGALTPELLLVDGTAIPGVSTAQRKIIKGDTLSQSVGAASILAKVTRDRIMEQAAIKYPQYGFERHMGYGTPEHLSALARFGPCPLHRFTFAPVRAVAQRVDDAVALYEALPPSLPDRRQVIGILSEDWVIAELASQGWQVRARRYRMPAGEIDAIMQDGDTIVFVEVRARSFYATAQTSGETELLLAAESVHVRKQQRLRRLAHLYLARENIATHVPVRFDVIAVAWTEQDGYSPRMEHMKSAF